jgi:transglutaminase-like putative cysteine protease
MEAPTIEQSRETSGSETTIAGRVIKPEYLSPKPLPGYVPPESGKYTLRVGCEFHYRSDWPTPAVLQVEAYRDGLHTLLEEKWETGPEIESREYSDVYGNRCRRLVIPVGDTMMRYSALVDITSDPDEVDLDAEQLPVELLPDETLIYTLGSRYCESDLLIGDAWKLFGDITPGWARVQAVCDWCHENIAYESGSSTPSTTALDVYRNRAGICRDFAHIGVTLCRALSIPARYCFGYMPDIAVIDPGTPMDFHAWFEVFLGGRWRTFDARHNTPRIGRVPIARGRDALDCAMITTYGAAEFQSMIVWAEESRVTA